jgi:hypothetical protein
MKLLHFAILSLLLCLPAQAQEIEYGTGLICDTRQQAEELVRHFDGDMDAALKAVNVEEHDPNACAVVTIAFVRGPEVATVRNKDAAFQVVRILVVGVGSPSGFRSVAPAAYVSLFKIAEYAV